MLYNQTVKITQSLPIVLLFLSLIAGQLIKPEIITNRGLTGLDYTVGLLALWGLVDIRFKLIRPPMWIISAIAVILVMVISLLLTPLHLTLTNFLVSFGYVSRFTAYILLGWVIYSGAFQALRTLFPRILIFSGLVLAAMGLIQLIVLPDLYFLNSNGWDPHYFRTVSTILDPNYLGAYLTLAFLLAYNYKSLLSPKISTLIFITLYLAILTTFSRSTIAIFSVSLITFSLLSKSIKSFAFSVVLILGLTGGFIVYDIKVVQVRNIDRIQSAHYRVSSWKQGKEIFLKSPILGVGYNNYPFALSQYKLAEDDFIRSRGSSGNDSSLLSVAATMGTIGLVVYLLLAYCLFKSAWDNPDKKKKLTLIPGLSGLIINSLFINSLFYPWIMIWIIAIMVSKGQPNTKGTLKILI